MTTIFSFGEVLKTLRKQSKVSQQKLATQLGVHLNTISKWERGVCLPTSKTLVLELARQLHLNAQNTRWLLETSLTTPSPYWYVPYQRNPFFTGREDLLQQMHKGLYQETTMLIRSLTVSGLAGIGKTQLAIEYAYRHANDYTAIFWIDAETTDSLFASYLAVAKQLDLPGKQEQERDHIVTAVVRWLNNHSDWLVIFDHVEDVRGVKRFLPSNRQGALLFTSRRQTLGITAQTLDLGKMTLEEGRHLLLKRARLLNATGSLGELAPRDEASAREIVIQMDGFPLALDQAGTHIETAQCSLSEYLRLFHISPIYLLNEREVYADHPASVAQTFTSVIAQLEQRYPAAIELLTVCAFLAPMAIPEEIFLEGANWLGEPVKALVAEPLMFQGAIQALLSYSLLQRHRTTRTMTIHRLMQVLVRERLSKSTQRTWGRRVIETMVHLFPSDHYTQVNYWQVGERLLPHALVALSLAEQWDEDQTLSAPLMCHVATYLSKHTRSSKAAASFEQAVQIGKLTWGSLHP